jgi:ABC-type transport system involved in multi-copper enzyme maturation permease subunit
VTATAVPVAAPAKVSSARTFLAVAGYAWRACFPRGRRLGLLLPCIGAVLLGALAQAVAGPPARSFATVASSGLFSIVFPIGCLVVGDAVFGAEVRAGTLGFTWLSPVRLSLIVTGRWLTGTIIAAVALGGSGALAAVVAGAPGAAGATALSMAVGSAAYVALFVLIGCTTRRAAVWSLAVVFLVERLLGSVLAGIAQLSPTWEARAVYTGIAPGADFLHREGIPEGGAAIVRLLVITVVCLAFASWRLRRLQLTGASD